MDDQSKSIEIRKVPTRKLLASVKLDIRKTMQASPSPRKILKKK